MTCSLEILWLHSLITYLEPGYNQRQLHSSTYTSILSNSENIIYVLFWWAMFMKCKLQVKFPKNNTQYDEHV